MAVNSKTYRGQFELKKNRLKIHLSKQLNTKKKRFAWLSSQNV